MSKVSSSMIRAQASEERLNLQRWLTKERIQDVLRYVESDQSMTVRSYEKMAAISGTRSCDCIIWYRSTMRLFLKLKPTNQTFLDALKQLKQESLLYVKYHGGYTSDHTFAIITYDSNTMDDTQLREQGVHIIRARTAQQTLEPYEPIDAI